MAKETVKTPIMEQFNKLKAKHPEAIMLFRRDNFYEAYDEDAVKVGKILGVTITQKLNSNDKGSDGHTMKMAGFPCYAIDTCLPQIILSGERVVFY